RQVADIVFAAPAEAAQDIADSSADKETLLHQAQFATRLNGVRGVENFRERLGDNLLFDRLDVVAGVENANIEFVGSARGEQAHEVDGFSAIAGDQQVGGQADERTLIDPSRLIAALTIVVLDPPVDRHHAGLFGTWNKPGRGILLPGIGRFDLVTVANFLAEQAELIVDAVAVAGHIQRGHRIEETGSESPESAIAERRVMLFIEKRLQVDAARRQ